MAAMLPRALYISEFESDAIFESVSVFVIGNILALTFYTLREERNYRAELEQAQEKMRFYLGEVNKAQEEERKRIAQELHDDTIQSMVVLSRGLESLRYDRRELPEDEYNHRLEKLHQLTVDTMTGIRRLSQDLRPAALDRLGLVSALESLSSDITKYWGIQIKVNVLNEIKRLSPDKELAIFRIVQEALRNVWRHSKATEAELTIESDGNIIKITVKDNGKGFEVPKDMIALPGTGKLGMAGMHERAQLIGARLKIEAEVGVGTQVSVIADIP
jgi:signal transduction histidine kinase